MKLIALLLASIAIGAQAHTPPPQFVRGMERRGTPVATAEFVGMHWACTRKDTETCWAGLRLATLELVTGP